MRKIFLIIFSFLFLLYFSFSSIPVFAQEQNAEIQATQSSQQKIEYNLPYPGILPDNPLYFLKAVRDKLVEILINDPLKKAEFNLLTSDKRISSAFALSDKGKEELAVDTLSKSNNYFEQAVNSDREAKKMGENVDTVLHNMELSAKKHEEILGAIEKKTSKSFSNQLQLEKEKLQKLGKSVSQIESK